jgi:hypothetical protein
VCRHRWVAVRKGDRICYAQWEDCGPFLTDHFQYVFGNERPKPNANHGAGLSVSPSVRDYLGLAPTDVVDWQFVEVRDVPPGPWRSYGDNNHFVIARRQMENKSAHTEPEITKAIPVQTQAEPEIKKSIAVAQAQQIRELAEEYSAAFAIGNYERVADLTYSKVLEIAGGREKVIDALRQGSAGINAHGDVILPSEVNEPNEIVTVADKEFAILPYTMRMKAANRTLHTKCFLIAISSDDGRTWTFIDGGPTRQDLTQLVPDFPAKLPLPTCKQPVLGLK